MDQDKKAIIQKRVIVILLIIFVAVFWYAKKKNSIKATLSGTPVTVFEMDRAKKELISFGGKKVEYRGKSLRNPLSKHLKIAMLEKEGAFPVSADKGFGGAKLTQEKLALEGIIWGGKKNLAIISGNVVSEGENIGSSKVKSIEKDRVVIIKDGNEIVLTR